MARVVFMGTPAFAVPALRVLWEDGYEIAAVVTQPDRPAGRSREPIPSPVKEFALAHGLPVWQPETLRPPEAVAHLQELAPDVGVVAAYGEILRRNVLAIPPRGFLNLHASLLPRHRGATPVSAAILAGDKETGVTLMLMDPGMDTGPIVGQESVPLSGKERTGELLLCLADTGAHLLRQLLPDWLAGKIEPRPQEGEPTYSSMLRREDGQIDWSRPAVYIERMTRSYDPWPGAYTSLHGRRLHIWEATMLPVQLSQEPGTIVVRGKEVLVVTGAGALRLEQVQIEGKRRVSAGEFLQGQRNLEGARLG